MHLLNFYLLRIAMKNLRFIIIVVLLSLLGVVAAKATIYHETTSKVTRFDYSDYTYTYIEDGVEKTAKLTDEATTTAQIKALLKAVYTDATIPGIHYAYDYNGTQVRKIDYNAFTHSGWNSNNNEMIVTWDNPDPTEFIPNPEQDGMTLLMVNLKQSWKRSHANGHSDDTDYMLENGISSVKLMPNFTRVNDPENPGYIFSVEGATNRFFILSKGKPRASTWAPFYRLFEQISPVKGEGGHSTTDFINDVRAGIPYSCYHDCTNVLGFGNSTTYDHWFEITTSGETYTLNNLSIFIPDRRLEYGYGESKSVTDRNETSDYSTDSQIFKNYENDQDDSVMPKVLMYTADLNAEAVPSETVGFYQVNLGWSTSFTMENLGVNIPQHFYVYIVEPDGTRTLIQEVEKENGLVVVRNYSYLVEQTADPQDISYVVTAHTINYDNSGGVILNDDGTPYITISAESPVRTVTIPGHNAFFTQASEYRSRYQVLGSGQEYNVYKNKLTIRPTTAEDYNVINTREHYEVTRTDANGVKVTIANVQFTPVAGSNNYDYVVGYNASTQNTSLLFDSETPVTSGTLTGFDNSIVTVIDRFTASTQNNDHSEKYTYAFERIDGEEYNTFSNRFVVPVYKTTNTVAGEGHTLEEVIADVNHTAKATPDNTITFNAINNPAANLVNYEIRRLVQNNFSNFTRIGKAENFNNSGEYYIYALNSSGQLNELVGITSISGEGGDITAHDVNKSSANQISSYVPVINTLYNGDASRPNSYGCDIQRVRYPQVKLAVEKVMKTAPYSGPGGQMMSYQVNLKITPTMPSTSESNINHVYYYRLWRLIDGKISPTQHNDEELLNKVDNISGVQNGVEWGTDYDCLYTTYPNYPYPSGNVAVYDIFTDWAYEDTKKVSYIVRLYATTIPGSSDTYGNYIDYAPKSVGDGEAGKDYFIAEATVNVTFNEKTFTAVDNINAKPQVESVTYYNMMGVASSRPYPGMNIVVKRMSNGDSVTTKTMY